MINRVKNFITTLHGKKHSGFIVALVTLLIIVPVSTTEAFESFELKLYDLRFRFKPSVKEWDKLFFLDIDDISITNLGQFPWTRDIYAHGLYTLTQISSDIPAFDIMFPDKSPILVNDVLYNRLITDYYENGSIELENLYSIITNQDQKLAEALDVNGKAILSYTFSPDKLPEYKQAEQQTDEFREYINIFNEKSSVEIPSGQIKDFSGMIDNSVLRIVYPIPDLITTTESFGFVNRYTDIDGTIRKVQLLEVYNNRIYFNLAIVMLVKHLGITLRDIEVHPGKELVLRNIQHPLKKYAEEIHIPIDKYGMIFVNWAGPGPREKSFRTVPFYGLLEYPNFVSDADSILEEILDTDSLDLKQKLVSEIETVQLEMEQNSNNTTKEKLDDLYSQYYKIRVSGYTLLESSLNKLKKQFRTNPSDSLQTEIENTENKLAKLNLILRIEELRNKITITGLTATGSTDIASIPIHNEYPGVGTYLNTINTIVQGEYIRRISDIFTWIIMTLICFLTGIVLQRQSARRSLFTGVTFFVSLNLAAFLIFIYMNIWINQLGINIAFLMPGVSIIASKLLSEESQRKYIKGAFSQFLSAEYINEIIQNPDLLKLGGENRIITTFFSDVAGFSTLSEGLSPTELVDRLNEYLSEMTDIIMAHGGYVDKYEGDAIMAFYGAPIPHPDHELKACLAAIDMKKKLRDLQDKWIKEGQQPLYVRMGMNTGDAVIGNMGSENKKNYTAMGDSVNLASRLEGANKFYSTKAMISETTYRAVSDKIEARKLDTIRVVGKTEPTVIYELLGIRESLPRHMYDGLEHYSAGMKFFEERQWKKALKHFTQAAKIVSDDGPSKKYIERCEEYIKKPPSKKWDGVYSLKSK